MTTTLRWTSGDLELLADEGKRYEILAENSTCPDSRASTISMFARA